jgi:hypothetical protein
MAYAAAKDMGCEVSVEIADSLVILRFYRRADLQV